MHFCVNGIIEWREFEGEELMGHQVEVISRQGRILLQVGALSAAGALFDRVKHMAENLPPSPTWMIQRIPAQLATNEGLLAFANTQYEPAMAAFKNSIDVLRTCQPSQGAVYHRDAFMGPVWVDTHADLLTVCWNNMALSALYTCRMKEAVRMMESVVREDPTSYLTERLAFNLCTLYELGADTTTSSRKKRVLQLVAKRFYLHDIGPESFRVS